MQCLLLVNKFLTDLHISNDQFDKLIYDIMHAIVSHRLVEEHTYFPCLSEKIKTELTKSSYSISHKNTLHQQLSSNHIVTRNNFLKVIEKLLDYVNFNRCYHNEQCDLEIFNLHQLFNVSISVNYASLILYKPVDNTNEDNITLCISLNDSNNNNVNGSSVEDRLQSCESTEDFNMMAINSINQSKSDLNNKLKMTEPVIAYTQMRSKLFTPLINRPSLKINFQRRRINDTLSDYKDYPYNQDYIYPTSDVERKQTPSLFTVSNNNNANGKQANDNFQHRECKEFLSSNNKWLRKHQEEGSITNGKHKPASSDLISSHRGTVKHIAQFGSPINRRKCKRLHQSVYNKDVLNPIAFERNKSGGFQTLHDNHHGDNSKSVNGPHFVNRNLPNLQSTDNYCYTSNISLKNQYCTNLRNDINATDEQKNTLLTQELCNQLYGGEGDKRQSSVSQPLQTYTLRSNNSNINNNNKKPHTSRPHNYLSSNDSLVDQDEKIDNFKFTGYQNLCADGYSPYYAGLYDGRFTTPTGTANKSKLSPTLIKRAKHPRKKPIVSRYQIDTVANFEDIAGKWIDENEIRRNYPIGKLLNKDVPEFIALSTSNLLKLAISQTSAMKTLKERDHSRKYAKPGSLFTIDSSLEEIIAQILHGDSDKLKEETRQSPRRSINLQAVLDDISRRQIYDEKYPLEEIDTADNLYTKPDTTMIDATDRQEISMKQSRVGIPELSRISLSSVKSMESQKSIENLPLDEEQPDDIYQKPSISTTLLSRYSVKRVDSRKVDQRISGEVDSKRELQGISIGFSDSQILTPGELKTDESAPTLVGDDEALKLQTDDKQSIPLKDMIDVKEKVQEDVLEQPTVEEVESHAEKISTVSHEDTIKQGEFTRDVGKVEPMSEGGPQMEAETRLDKLLYDQETPTTVPIYETQEPLELDDKMKRQKPSHDSISEEDQEEGDLLPITSKYIKLKAKQAKKKAGSDAQHSQATVTTTSTTATTAAAAERLSTEFIPVTSDVKEVEKIQAPIEEKLSDQISESIIPQRSIDDSHKIRSESEHLESSEKLTLPSAQQLDDKVPKEKSYPSVISSEEKVKKDHYDHVQSTDTIEDYDFLLQVSGNLDAFSTTPALSSYTTLPSDEQQITVDATDESITLRDESRTKQQLQQQEQQQQEQQQRPSKQKDESLSKLDEQPELIDKLRKGSLPPHHKKSKQRRYTKPKSKLSEELKLVRESRRQHDEEETIDKSKVLSTSQEETLKRLQSKPSEELTDEERKLLNQLIEKKKLQSAAGGGKVSTQVKLHNFLSQSQPDQLSPHQRKVFNLLKVVPKNLDEKITSPSNPLYKSKRRLCKLLTKSFDRLTPEELAELEALARLFSTGEDDLKEEEEGGERGEEEEGEESTSYKIQANLWPWSLSMPTDCMSISKGMLVTNAVEAATEHFANLASQYSCQTDDEKYPPFVPSPLPTSDLFDSKCVSPEIRFWPWSEVMSPSRCSSALSAGSNRAQNKLTAGEPNASSPENVVQEMNQGLPDTENHDLSTRQKAMKASQNEFDAEENISSKLISEQMKSDSTQMVSPLLTNTSSYHVSEENSENT
ncbi:unnamed protein product [Trichobilharzia szidati]|nr:unnamed protein product [Trichobilharzia szidati]